MNKRKIIRSVGAVLAGVVLGVLLLVGVLLLAAVIWIFFFGEHAERKANALCDATAIGSPADAALERAKQAGSATRDLRWVEAEDGEQDLVVYFPDNDPRSGSICSISARDGKVTRVKIGDYIVD